MKPISCKTGKEFLLPPVPKSVLCPYCGKAIDDPENYCGYCGGKLAIVCQCWKKDGQLHSCPEGCDSFNNSL